MSLHARRLFGHTRTLLSLGALAALAACSADAPTAATSTGPSRSASSTGQAVQYLHARACPTPGPGEDVRCHALVRVNAAGQPLTTATPSGYGPADLTSAYNLTLGTGTSWTWNGQTIAIVDAYDDPNAENDLNVYRSQYGLPPCTAASGCFTKVNQSGGTSYPKADGGWAQEISLDLDMASAICPQCKIILVEASSASNANLGTAVNTAATLKANAISNSYGGSESSSAQSYEKQYYYHPGIAVTASSGDNGYGVEFPASSQYVTAVGGTTLNRASNARGWSESVWSGAGSGCSAYISKPSWQKDTGCSKRTVADVAAVADPNTGVAVYDSYAYRGSSGWLVFGGTSVASPIVASIYALAGNASTVTQSYASNLYSHTSSLFDITSGSNGTCSGTYPYLCTGVTGYDGPTGLGTPNGTGAF